MKPNALRGAVAVFFLVALTGAYLLGRGAGERAAVADAARSGSHGPGGAASGSSLSAIGSGADRGAAAGGGAADSDDGEKQNVKSIIAQARAKMQGGMMNASGMMRALAMLDGISDEQIGEALAEVERSVKEPQQKMMFGMLLLGRWAESDGPAALAYADEHFSSKNPMMMGVKSSVVSAWAQNDPEGAWAWYQKQEDDSGGGGFRGGRSMAVMGIISSMAMKDVDMAFDKIALIEGQQERQMAMQGLGQAIWDEDKRAAILTKIDSMEDEADKAQARNSVIAQWSQIDPDGALEWAATLEEKDRSATVKQVAQSLSWSDPERSGELLLTEAATPEERSQAYASTISTWAHNDANGAGEWLGKQEQSPELDQARQQFANSVVQKDPESAMAWANAVSDEEKRSNAVQGIYLQWRANDEAAANAALSETDLSRDRIDALKGMEVPAGEPHSIHLDAFGVSPTEVRVEAADLPAVVEE
jgi:cyanate lyase